MLHLFILLVLLNLRLLTNAERAYSQHDWLARELKVEKWNAHTRGRVREELEDLVALHRPLVLQLEGGFNRLLLQITINPSHLLDIFPDFLLEVFRKAQRLHFNSKLLELFYSLLNFKNGRTLLHSCQAKALRHIDQHDLQVETLLINRRVLLLLLLMRN